MYTRNDLLDICFSLGVSGEEEKFCRFAQEYALGMKTRGITDTKEFFDVLKFSRDNAENPAVLRKLGISGKGSNGGSIKLKAWCKKLLDNSELKKLDITELNMLMGYCSREAKIKESGL